MNKYRCFVLLIILLYSVNAAYSRYPGQDAPKDLSFYTPPEDTSHLPLIKKSKAKNIILLIGDGMGLGIVNTTKMRIAGADGCLYLEKMPITGLCNTHSVNRLTTDSAAAGTALATGKKTNNTHVSVDQDGNTLQTILEAAASKKGKFTGLVVTTLMTRATPAVFGAHVKKRVDQATIAEHYIENRINVLFGGGKQYFIPRTSPGSLRTDDKDLIAEAIASGYKFIETEDELQWIDNEDHVLGLFQMGTPTTISPEPSLAEMTSKAIKLLNRNKNGFFMMVEGSQIDWAAHANDADYVVRQTLLFDLAVKVALDFAMKDKNTLVVVTADHECGGVILIDGKKDGSELEINFSTNHHTPMQVPVYAFGPGAENFTGVHDNTDIAKIFAMMFRIKKLN